MERYSKKWMIVVAVLLLLRVVGIGIAPMSRLASQIVWWSEVLGFLAFLGCVYPQLVRQRILEWSLILRYTLRHASLYILLGAVLGLATLKLSLAEQTSFSLVEMTFVLVVPYVFLVIFGALVMGGMLRMKKRFSA